MENYKIEQKVLASFTNCFNIFQFEGIITKINKNTARVKTLNDGVNGWEAGHEFIIQLENSPTYSINNRIIKKIV